MTVFLTPIRDLSCSYCAHLLYTVYWQKSVNISLLAIYCRTLIEGEAVKSLPFSPRIYPISPGDLYEP